MSAVSDKSKGEPSSWTSPGTADMPGWMGVEPGFTDLEEKVKRGERGMSQSNNHVYPRVGYPTLVYPHSKCIHVGQHSDMSRQADVKVSEAQSD